MLMEINTLDTSEVLQIYDFLVSEFARTEDPIDPVGVRDINLLESAVYRQNVSNGSVLKYRTPIYNAASLGYGICNNHPFYNGNKRTALVSILAHLDKNKLSLFQVGEDKLYDFMIAVAEHRIAELTAEKLNINIVFEPGETDSDVEVRMMGRWLTYHAAPVKRGEDRKITYQELRKILRRFSYDLVNPSSARIHIVRVNRDGTSTNVHSVYYPGEMREVSLTVIKAVRARCRLREEDGIDSEAFYWNALQISEFVNKHRLVLRRLADA
jgi:death-on-curing family protein